MKIRPVVIVSLFFLLSASAALILLHTPVFAAAASRSAQLRSAASPSPNSTPTASASPTATPAANQNSGTTAKLRERLQKILGSQDSADTAKQKAGYIGQVTRINNEAITLKTLSDSEIIPIDDTIILLKRGQKIPLSDVTVGTWLIVIGERERNKAVRPQLLLVQTADLKPKEHIATVGIVTETSGSTVSLIPRGKTEPLTFNVTKNSKLIDATGETFTLKQLPKDVAVLAVGYASDKGWDLGTLKSLVAMTELKSSATPAPTPKPTAAVKPSPSPTSGSTPAPSPSAKKAPPKSSPAPTPSPTP